MTDAVAAEQTAVERGSADESAVAGARDSGPELPAARLPGEALVVVRALHKSFMHMGRQLDVLRGIDLTIHDGDLMAIVGPSGAGKSTLLHCIGTLDEPSLGSIELDGRELVGMDGESLAALRNKHVGFVFQFHHLLPEFTALENVLMPGLIQGLSRAQVRQRAEELLDEVGLAHRLTHRPGELSGGEQQRVALARALILEPKLLLADEPTGNLDTATSDAIHKLFFDINRSHGTTIVIVTHNVALANALPRVVRMVDGKVDTDTRGPASLRELDPKLVKRQHAMEQAEPGGFGRRMAAKLIDHFFLLLLVVGAAALAWVVAAATGVKPEVPQLNGQLILFAGGVMAGLAYFTLSEWIGGTTLRKAILGLVVRTQQLERASLRSALVRNIAYYTVDTMFFGLIAYIAMAGSLTRQRLGDMWGRTTVMRSHSVDNVGHGVAGIFVGAGASLLILTLVGVAVYLWPV